MVSPAAPDPAGLLARGLAVIALPPGGRRPGPGWHTAHLAEAQLLREHWRPGDNIGVPCRPNRLVVLDLDRKNGIDGIAALVAAADTASGPVPDTLTVATPHGGRHLYYRLPPGRTIGSTSGGTSGLGPGIDTRGPGARFGGYVVGPDSLVGGLRYTVAGDAPIAELPAWIADVLTRTAVRTRTRALTRS